MPCKQALPGGCNSMFTSHMAILVEHPLFFVVTTFWVVVALLFGFLWCLLGLTPVVWNHAHRMPNASKAHKELLHLWFYVINAC